MSHTLQVERNLDTINDGTGRYVIKHERHPKQAKQDLAIKKFIKTRKYDFRPEVHVEDYESETEFVKHLPRDTNKLNKTNYVVEPRQVISELHEKTHYHAGLSMSQNRGCMSLKTKQYNKEFMEIES